MKKILLTLIPILAIGFMTNAQITYTITSDTAYLNLANDNVPHKAKITLTNNGSTAVDFEWRMVQVNKPADWLAPGVCDWVNCYLFDDYSWHTTPVAANATHDLYIEMRRTSTSSTGCSQVGIEYREKGTPTQYQVLRHSSGADLTSCPPLWSVGTSSLSLDKLVAIYPNPTANIINLNIHDKNVKSVQLSNLIGKQIQRVNVSNSNGSIHQMSLQALPKGIYILQFKNDTGKILGVSRITKQ